MDNKKLPNTDEIQFLQDPRTGEQKEVDLSTAALSRTMAEIRAAAEIINNCKNDIKIINEQLLEIESLVLNHAQFSPKLENLQVRILDRNIEVVRNFNELQAFRINYIRNLYITEANNELSKYNTSSIERRRNSINSAVLIVSKGLEFLPDDQVLVDYCQMLQDEYDNIDSKIKKKQALVLYDNKRLRK